MNSDPRSDPTPESLLGEFLARLEDSGAANLEDLCAAHPDSETELRRVWAEHRRALVALEARGVERAESTFSISRNLEAGSTLGDFELLELIGQGGMGQVWRAMQVSLNRTVALKLVRPDRLSPRTLDMFAREARAGGRLNHQGIVAIHAYGEDDGVAWIAMEYVEGAWNLRDFIDQATRDEELSADYYNDIALITAQVAEALHFAHAANIIHRDVKPQNILLTSTGDPKVTDFGLARITDESGISMTGEIAGTYYYMSPEQVNAKRSGIDHRTDVFSLGVVLFELLTLRRPFEGDTTQQVAYQILMVDPLDPLTIRSRIPRDLAVICNKCLEKEPERRFETMAEIVSELQCLARNEPIKSRPPTRFYKALKWAKRHPTKSVAALLASCAFVAITLLSLRIANQNAELELNNLSLERKTIEANANASLARKKEAEARQRAEEVLRLSLGKEYDDLITDADKFWPAYPSMIGVLEGWVDRAQNLVDQLPELRRKRDSLRALALPRLEEQRRVERESHPYFSTLESLELELAAMRAAHDQRTKGIPVELPVVDWEQYPSDSFTLGVLAWARVRPDRTRHGEEGLGLLLAQRANESSQQVSQVTTWVTLAYALCAVGRDDEALQAVEAALEAARMGEARPAKLEVALDEVRAMATRSDHAALLESKAQELAECRSHVDERREWTFEPEHKEASWWHDQLTKLIANIESLELPGTGHLDSMGVTKDGWSVLRRIESAKKLRDAFEPGGEYEVRWRAELPSIRADYPGLALGIQVGLVPLGPDPDSGLWEFWHVQSGAEPVVGDGGTLNIEEDTGIVLVLIPGDSFWMGAQSTAAFARQYDKWASSDEGPVHEVELSAFFLSKFEMTQGQWLRLTGSNPSRYGPSTKHFEYSHDLTHPVEQISWFDCDALLPRFDLQLPTEAQWEYAARARTETPWWTGEDRDSLREMDAANLADVAARRGGQSWTTIDAWPELDDGFAVHAPVDRSAPNPFGIVHIHGNVWEWCEDAITLTFYGQSPRLDPVNPGTHSDPRVVRGSAFNNTAVAGRCSARISQLPTGIDISLGVRPARGISH